MDVRLGDVRDAEPRRRGGREVALEVAVRVDDERLSGALAADEVARLGEGGIVDTLEVHGGIGGLVWPERPGRPGS